MSISALLVNNDLNLDCSSLTLATTGGTATALNYYEQTTAFSYTLIGGLTSPKLTGYYVRENNVVTIFLNAISSAAAAGSAIYTAASTIPTRFRPSGNSIYPIMVLDNSVMVNGVIQIGSDGSIYLFSSGGTAFQATGNCGLYRCAITYSL
jgi:hypothetical protein